MSCDVLCDVLTCALVRFDIAVLCIVMHAVLCAGLLDPRWREQQQKSVEDKKQQEEVYAAGTQIGSNLKYLADYRTDIFGQEETVIGRKVGVHAV